METALYFIAGTASAIFLIRLVLMLIGLDSDAGGEMLGVDATPDAISAHDMADAADFKIFTFMTFIVTFMVGGWASLLFLEMGWAQWMALTLGGAIGFVAALGVTYAMFSMRKLEHDGTLRKFEAKGVKGTCYIKVPEAGAGKGQVQVTIKGRLFTFDAVSDGPEIPSFKPVVVMERLDEKTLRVCPTE
jgi:hypothetical protein